MTDRHTDSVVLYESPEDGCWIAHTLRTDQVGTGDRPVAALADAIQAVQQVWRLAERDESVAFYREAPPEVQQQARQADPLPAEIFEVAYKLATGEWPEEWETPEPREHKTYLTDLPEPLAG